jgi:dTDP-4-dehydrorhamnose reductase
MEKIVLATGASGMLGMQVMLVFGRLGIRCHGVDLPDGDLTDIDQVREIFRRTKPTHAMHCAAYTDVERAETDAETCRRANVDAPRNVARVCAERGVRFQMIGTDFVFDGARREPYATDATPNPNGVYATTKWEGERAAASETQDFQVVRTAWLFGPGKRNFVEAIRGKLAGEGELTVVADQEGCPTCTLDLVPRLVSLLDIPETGVFHIAGSGHCSWFEFAREIARQTGADPERVRPIASSDWPGRAPRPAWSVLDCSRSVSVGIDPMPDWKAGLATYLEYMRREGERV